jgi:hypothetical protein
MRAGHFSPGLFKAGGAPIKGRRAKMPKPTRRNTPNVQARSKVPPATEETEVVRLTREPSEEREQRAGTSEVLHLLTPLPETCKR